MTQDGTYPVTIGDSFTNDVKSYHSFKHSFIPESADINAPAFLSQPAPDSHWVLSLQHLSGPVHEPHELRSIASKSKELDCVLIYNSETNTYTLERLESSFHFQPVRGLKKSALNSANSKSDRISPVSSSKQKLVPESQKKTTNSINKGIHSDSSSSKRQKYGRLIGQTPNQNSSPPSFPFSNLTDDDTIIQISTDIVYNTSDEHDIDEFDLDQIVAETIGEDPLATGPSRQEL